jgi:hypothetical protein
MSLFVFWVVSTAFLAVSGANEDLDNQAGCLNCFNIDFDNSIWLKQNEEPGSVQNLVLSGRKTTNEDLFGFSLALVENRVYIGAPGYDIAGTLFQCLISRDTSGNTSPCYDTKVNEKFNRLGKIEL